MSVGNLEELIDENHAIVSSSMGPEYYVGILSFVRQGLSRARVRDPHAQQVTKVEKAPLESYAHIGGLDAQIQEIKEAVELPLTHPELYEDIGIKPPKGVILYGEPGTRKTLLAKLDNLLFCRLTCYGTEWAMLKEATGLTVEQEAHAPPNSMKHGCASPPIAA